MLISGASLLPKKKVLKQHVQEVPQQNINLENKQPFILANETNCTRQFSLDASSCILSDLLACDLTIILPPEPLLYTFKLSNLKNCTLSIQVQTQGASVSMLATRLSACDLQFSKVHVQQCRLHDSAACHIRLEDSNCENKISVAILENCVNMIFESPPDSLKVTDFTPRDSPNFIQR